MVANESFCENVRSWLCYPNSNLFYDGTVAGMSFKIRHKLRLPSCGLYRCWYNAQASPVCCFYLLPPYQDTALVCDYLAPIAHHRVRRARKAPHGPHRKRMNGNTFFGPVADFFLSLSVPLGEVQFAVYFHLLH